MKVLLTGAAGFIGSHLAEALLARGHTVVGLDSFDPFYAREIKERNLAAVAEHGSFRFVEGDILDAPLLSELVAEGGFDAIAHMAALAGVRPSIREPARYQRVNVEGTCNVAGAALAHGVSRLVFASSSSVYGNNTELPYRETDRVDLPASPYAASKRAGELLLQSLHHVHRLNACCLRFFTVYGPRQRPEMAIHKFVRLVERGEPIPMFGDGTTSRDYTYVDDVVAGTVAAVERAPAGLSIYNLGNTEPVSLRELVDAVGEATGKVPRIERLPPQPGDVERTLASVDAARRDLGYSPSVSIPEGLRRFVDWYRQRS